MTCSGVSCFPSEGDMCGDQRFQSGKYMLGWRGRPVPWSGVMTNIRDHRKGRGKGRHGVLGGLFGTGGKDVIWGMLLLDALHGPCGPLVFCNSPLGNPVIIFGTEQAEHSRRQRHLPSHTQARGDYIPSGPFLTQESTAA